MKVKVDLVVGAGVLAMVLGLGQALLLPAGCTTRRAPPKTEPKARSAMEAAEPEAISEAKTIESKAGGKTEAAGSSPAGNSPVMRKPADLVAARDGGFYLAGSYLSPDHGQGFWIWKLDARGEALWQKTFPSEKQEEVTALMATDDGGVLAVGLAFVYQPRVGYRSWIRKLNKVGDIEYTQTIRGYGRAGVILEADGGNYLLGGTGKPGKKERSKNTEHTDRDTWLAKIDPRGKVLWELFHDRGSDESAYSGINAEGGGFVFIGSTGKYNKFGQGPSEIWLFKIDSAGKIVAEIRFPDGRIMSKGGPFIAKNGKQFAVVYSTSQLPDIRSVDVSRVPSFTAEIVALDYELKKLWSKRLADYSSVVTPLVTATADGNYLVAGAVRKGPRIDKIGGGGKVIWSQTTQVRSKGSPVYNVLGLVLENSVASIAGSVMDPMSGDLGEEVFFLGIDAKSPKLLWRKSY